MKNKKGKSNSAVVLLGIILAVVLVGGIVWFGVSQSQIARTNVELVAGDCQTAPTITVSTTDAINPGTSVSPTIRAIVNGAYIGEITSSTNFKRGDKVQLLLNASDYLDTVLPEFSVDCGNNIISASMYATSTNSFRLFNTNGNLVTDSATGGAVNQSSSASPISMDLRIDSTVDQSTGDLVIVIEASNTSEVDQITLSGDNVESTEVPQFYSVNSASAIVKAFKVPALIDGESESFTLLLSPESGQTIGGAGTGVITYITAYSEQAYLDKDGKFKVGVEDSDGNAKYEDTWDFDFAIAG